MIELSDVCMRYGEKTVFSSLSLRLEAPGAYALLGPSGCGKTTLMRLIAGLQKPTSGSVRVRDGVRMAICFQEDRLLPWKNALQNVMLACSGPDRAAKARDWLAHVGLEGECGALPASLSGGMQRRVALARALAADAPVLLLDEPFRALDEQTHARMLELVRQAARGRLCLLITHDERDAQGMICLRLEDLQK